MARVSIVTLGCPKNAVDSETLAGLLASGGHDLTPEPRDADVVVVNTCGFIEAARRETVEEVLDLAELKREAGVAGLVLTGCLVARSATELAETLPEVDGLVDFAAYPRIAEIVARAAAGEGGGVHGRPGTRFDPAWWDAELARGPRLRLGATPWAYLKISEGCDRGCAFCSIPLMRGRLRSRPGAVVEAEARRLVESGVTEICLVSQDSVMWGRDTGEGDLVGLLRRLERVPGLRRLRLMYLHPQGVTDALIEAVLCSEVVVNYFDLSLQHTSPPVLRAMGRWGGRARFESIIGRIRAGDPLAGVRATFILGFPGESEEDARDVERFVYASDIDWVGVFAYSSEPGTRARDLPGQLPGSLVRERSERVATAAEHTMARRAASLVGEELEVLVERFDPDERAWACRSHREAPEIDGEIRIAPGRGLGVGRYAGARVTGSSGADLVACGLGTRVG